MAATLKIVPTDGGDDDPVYARSLEDRIKWLKQVKICDLAASALKVAMCLFDHCNSKTGLCNPSRETIEKECRITTPQRAIRQLCQAGLIEVRRSPHKCNQYFLILHDEDNLSNGAELLTQRSGTAHPMEQNCSESGAELLHKPVVNLESNLESEPESEPGPTVADLWARHELSEKDLDYASENGVDNSRSQLELPCFNQYNIDQKTAYTRQHFKWKCWIKQLLVRERDQATGDSPKSREQQRTEGIKRLLAKPSDRSPETAKLFGQGPSQIHSLMEKFSRD